jgi:carboxyl-terminal processing protease
MNRLTKALLLLNLGMFLVAPTCVSRKVDRGSKSMDQYWAETGLGSSELDALLAPESCQATQANFLSCVNSIEQMAERYSLMLSFDGKFQKIRLQDVERRVTEKKDLAPWVPLYEAKKTQISFLDLFHSLLEQYVAGPEKSAVIASGINAFISVYKDPHSYLMPVAMYEEVVANSESRNTNAGFVARRNKQELVVRKVYDGSPAQAAGLKKGDRILALNGESVSALLNSRINDLLKMRDNQRLGLKIARKNEKKYLEILRSETVYPSVVSKLLAGPKPIGLITIHKFSKNICELTRKQLVSLKEQNIQGLLLDLRDNPGGQVEEAACVANFFVAKGTILFETRYLDISKPSERYIAEKDPIFNGPLGILINSGSASASEIVAGSLRDLNRAKLIGERSFGKGSFQDGRVWGPNSKIALFETQGFYYFASGWTPQLSGLQPDIQVNFNLADLREDELYLNPLVPSDSWTGPQTLSWLNEKECDDGFTSALASFNSNVDFEDPQLQKAQAVLSCGEKNGRNGSL